MKVFLCASDLAIALAIRSGELRIEERAGRFGPFWSIEDAHGVIETAHSRPAADRIVNAVAKAIKDEP